MAKTGQRTTKRERLLIVLRDFHSEQLKTMDASKLEKATPAIQILNARIKGDKKAVQKILRDLRAKKRREALDKVFINQLTLPFNGTVEPIKRRRRKASNKRAKKGKRVRRSSNRRANVPTAKRKPNKKRPS